MEENQTWASINGSTESARENLALTCPNQEVGILNGISKEEEPCRRITRVIGLGNCQ